MIIAGKEMHLQKTTNQGFNGMASTPEPAVKNALTAKPTAPVSAPPVAVSRSVSSLIAAAGLPADRLSASIISFARFFSLPLKPELMAEIRRQAFTQPSAAANNTPEAADNTRTLFSLAAAAAESKGVELSPKGLEAFAQAIDPERNPAPPASAEELERQNPEEHDPGDRQHRDKNREQTGEPEKSGSITAGSLKETAYKYMENNPLFAILNRMPGKNGQRWIVFPFDFSENDRTFKVSLRVLLDTLNDNMVLDIVENGETRWFFVINAVNGRINRLTASFKPELPPKAQSLFARELSQLLGIKPENIFIRNWKEPFPHESSCGDELRSIDEAV